MVQVACTFRSEGATASPLQVSMLHPGILALVNVLCKRVLHEWPLHSRSANCEALHF